MTKERMKAKTNTVDTEEIARFSALADTWWDPCGPMAPLHKINPLRVGYIRDKIVEHFHSAKEEKNFAPHSLHLAPLAGVRLLDIGCGAGLVCEPMARLGVHVTGIDASQKNIEVACVHAAQSGLEIDYRCMTAEELVDSGQRSAVSQKTFPDPLAAGRWPLAASYDVVLALEIIEHVADIPAFVAATVKLVKPGGLLIYSTINRTAKAWALAVVGAEYVLRWLPRGTHDWNKFVKPSELAAHLRASNIAVKEMTGLVMNKLTWKWELNPKDVDVNYLLVATKPL